MHSPRRPVGTRAKSVFVQDVHDRVFGGAGRTINTPNAKAVSTPAGMTWRVAAAAGGGCGIKWAKPNKNYDAELGYGKNRLVYVAPDNTAVTAGVIGPDGVATVKAFPGLWVSLQPVSLEETAPESGIFKHYVPTWPAPAPDDPDDPDNYWWPILPGLIQTIFCVDGVETSYYIPAFQVP